MVSSYSFRSGVGTFVIRPHQERPGMWVLLINGSYLGSYYSPSAAADEVATHTTGFAAWDSQQAQTGRPRDLDDWEHHNS